MSLRRVSGLLLLSSSLAACGGGGSNPAAPPASTPTPVPTPVPTPIATPTPPVGGCPDGSCGNTNAVVRAQVKLYLMFDPNRNPVPAPDPERQVVKEPIKVGYTIRLDVTGRDADNRETDGKGQIEWFYSDAGLVEINPRTPWTHDFKIVKPGPWWVYVVFDGVGSNNLNFTFVD